MEAKGMICTAINSAISYINEVSREMQKPRPRQADKSNGIVGNHGNQIEISSLIWENGYEITFWLECRITWNRDEYYLHKKITEYTWETGIVRHPTLEL